MASGRRIHGGKKWGRAQALVAFAADVWEEFDAWCFVRGVENPWRLPSWKFASLLMHYLKDDKTEEGLAKIDTFLETADATPHVYLSDSFRLIFREFSGLLRTLDLGSLEPSKKTLDFPVSPDLPVEERKRREAAASNKAYRVPEWWNGERANYQIARSMMGALPKKIGSKVEIEKE